MKIKDKTLKIIIATSVIVAVSVASFFIVNKNNNQDKQLQSKLKRIGELLNKMADEEYNKLYREYESYVDMINEAGPSNEYRGIYLYKLESLLETPGRYKQSGIDSLDLKAFEARQKEYEEYDKMLLHEKAIKNIKNNY